MRPLVLHRRAPEAKRRGGFVDSEARKIAQTHNLGFTSVQPCEAIERRIERDEIDIRFLLGHFDGVEWFSRPAAAATVSGRPARPARARWQI